MRLNRYVFAHRGFSLLEEIIFCKRIKNLLCFAVSRSKNKSNMSNKTPAYAWFCISKMKNVTEAVVCTLKGRRFQKYGQSTEKRTRRSLLLKIHLKTNPTAGAFSANLVKPIRIPSTWNTFNNSFQQL